MINFLASHQLFCPRLLELFPAPGHHGSHAGTALARMSVEHVPYHADVFIGGLVEFHVELSEYRGDDEEDLGFGEAGYVAMGGVGG